METILTIFEEAVRSFPSPPFLQMKRGGEWVRISRALLKEESLKMAFFLAGEGIRKGDTVALLTENRPEWGIAFLGILMAGGVVVPVDVRIDTKEYILRDSKARALIHSKKFERSVSSFAVPSFSLDDRFWLDLSLPAPGATAGHTPPFTPPDPEDLALVVYTSGTTGEAKGVMLTHGNVTSNVLNSLEILGEVLRGKRMLSLLPLNHMLEITGGFLAGMVGGGTITYIESLNSAAILEACRETESELMLAVPALLKLLHDGIEKKVRKASGGTRFLFHLLKIASSVSLDLLNLRAGRVLFRAVHRQFGGHLDSFICGGAPLEPDLQRGMEILGFRVLQGYGLTETAPILTVNPLHRPKSGSVGRAIPGVEIRIAEDGEILARGPNIMRGYLNKEEATEEVLHEGWFCSGDIGHLDQEGYLFITGRKKNLIVTAAGKKIAPEELEEKLLAYPLIKDVCVLGKKREDGGEEAFALIIPDLDQAIALGMAGQDQGETSKIVQGEIARIVKEYNQKAASYKKIMGFRLWEGEFPKTTTLKIKRKELARALERASASSALPGSG